MTEPRYPVFIPSKGRWQHGRALTARCLAAEGIPFKLVVEPQEADDYAAAFGEANVLVLPFSDLGQGSIPARNWIKEHAAAKRHWQLDDNMRGFYRQYHGKRIPCPAGWALRQVEDFTDRYENVAVSGMTYTMFGFPDLPPFHLNCHVYSCTLINGAIPHRWRGRYNEDTDLCLQVLADGWCTILVNAVQVSKMRTMTVGGGNTDDLYRDDGRLEMAASLAEQWPEVVKVGWRYGRPQHVVDWQKFRTPLVARIAIPPKPSNGVRLAAVDEVKSPRLKRLLAESG